MTQILVNIKFPKKALLWLQKLGFITVVNENIILPFDEEFIHNFTVTISRNKLNEIKNERDKYRDQVKKCYLYANNFQDGIPEGSKINYNSTEQDVAELRHSFNAAEKELHDIKQIINRRI